MSPIYEQGRRDGAITARLSYLHRAREILIWCTIATVTTIIPVGHMIWGSGDLTWASALPTLIAIGVFLYALRTLYKEIDKVRLDMGDDWKPHAISWEEIKAEKTTYYGYPPIFRSLFEEAPHSRLEWKKTWSWRTYWDGSLNGTRLAEVYRVRAFYRAEVRGRRMDFETVELAMMACEHEICVDDRNDPLSANNHPTPRA